MSLPPLNLKTHEVVYLEKEVLPLMMAGLAEVLSQSKVEGSNTRDFKPLQYLAAYLKIKNPRKEAANRQAYHATKAQSVGRGYLARRRVKAMGGQLVSVSSVGGVETSGGVGARPTARAAAATVHFD